MAQSSHAAVNKSGPKKKKKPKTVVFHRRQCRHVRSRSSLLLLLRRRGRRHALKTAACVTHAGSCYVPRGANDSFSLDKHTLTKCSFGPQRLRRNPTMSTAAAPSSLLMRHAFQSTQRHDGTGRSRLREKPEKKERKRRRKRRWLGY